MTASLFNFFKRFRMRNPELKFLSLMVAFCIWGLTSHSRETRYEINIPVKLTNIPKGYIVASQPAREIGLTLSGPSQLISSVRRSNTALVLNLQSANPGKTLFSHLETNLKLPEGINITRISPASLEICLIKAETKHHEGDQHP